VLQDPAGRRVVLGMGDAVRLAVGTLSVLPAPMPRTVDRVVAGRAMLLAPAVGLAMGGIAAGLVAAAQLLRPDAPLLAGVLGILVLAGLSGGLHLDGLADTADGLGSRRDREVMLRIMKQGDIGPFGVLTIVGVLLVEVAAATACVQAGIGWQAFLIAGTASRLTLPWACRTGVPSARPDGLGAMVAATVRPAHAAAVSGMVVVGSVVLLRLTHPETAGGSVPLRLWIGAAAAGAVAVGIGLLVVRAARRRLGGITGDVLGAGVELALAGALLSLALVA
jgi:adenosylcobinamide-GDP ribazoletransferase